MANQVFNIGLGRVVDFFNRVKSNEINLSTLVVMILRTANLESDAGLKQRTTFQDIIVTGTSKEAANTGYARKVLTDTDLASFAWAPTQASNFWALDMPDQTWNGVVAGDNWSRFVVGYDPSSSGVTNSLIIPLTMHDFVVTPDGSDITAQIAAAGFFQAS